MYIINVFSPTEWQLSFDCTPYKISPKKGQSLKAWANESNSTLTFNLAFFNMPTAANKAKGIAYNTIQYMRIAALGGDVAYGCGNNQKIILPNGDFVAGYKHAIIDGKVVAQDNSTKRSRNMLGITTDNRYIVVQTSNGYTEKNVATYINSYIPKYYNTNVKLLVIMDAGGSTGCYSNASKLLFAPEKEGTNGRSVASVLNLTRLSTAPKVSSNYISKTSPKSDIKLLQQILGGLEIDGSFGPNTEAKLKQAQKALNIPVTGKADEKTLTALNIPFENANTNTFLSYKAKVTCSALNIRTGPGTTYSKIGTLKKDATMEIDNENGEWGHIANTKNWINLNYIQKI